MSDRTWQAPTRLALLALACLGLGAHNAAAQAPPVTATWVDQIGEEGPYEQTRAVGVVAGSVYAAGPGGGLGPAFLRRYSDTGTLLWDISLATGTPFPPRLLAEQAFVCVGGSTRLYLDGSGPVLGESVGFVRCLDPDGDLLASDEIHATHPIFTPYTYVEALATAPGALYVIGRTTGALTGCEPACTHAGIEDAFVRKYSFDGTSLSPEWTRQYGTAGNDSFMGLSVEASGATVRVWGVEQVMLNGGPPWSANTLLLGCYYDDGSECGSDRLPLGDEAPLSGAFAGEAFYLARSVADPSATWGFATVIQKLALVDGIVILQEDWSDSLPNAYGYDMVVDGTGVVLAGLAQIPLPGQAGVRGQDAFARRYDESGAPSWTVQFGTLRSDAAFAVALDSTGLFLGGYTSGVLVDGFTFSGDTDGFVARIERPDSPRSAVGGLIVRVRELVDEGTLKNGQGRSLIGKLQVALLSLEVGNTRKAVTMLEAFVHQIRAFKNAGILEPGVADELIAIAEAAIASVSP